LDNYNAVIGNAEECDTPCRDEEEAFLDAILATEPIQLLQSWLVDKGLFYFVDGVQNWSTEHNCNHVLPSLLEKVKHVFSSICEYLLFILI
jgi:hypothetical protein